MNRVIWLAPGESKCTAQNCQAGPCARRDVSADGRPQGDLSAAVWHNGPACCAPKYVKRILPSEAVKPVAGPAVKDWIGS